MLVDFFPLENVLFSDFQFLFPRESSLPRRIPGSELLTVPKAAKIKIILSKLDTNKTTKQEQSSKMLIYWSVPDRLVAPGTESLTRHLDLLDAVTHRHLQLVNLAKDKLVSSSTFSSSHLQNFDLFFTDASISDTRAFSPFASTIRKEEIYDQVVGSLSGQVFQSSCHQIAGSRSTVDTITKWPPIRLESLNAWLASGAGLLPFIVASVTQHVWLLVAKAKQIYAIWECAV